MVYLSGSSGPLLRKVAFTLNIGLLMTPDVGYAVWQLAHYPVWAADNSCFAQGDAFDVERWLAWLDRLPRCALFAVAPDVLGDPVATLARSEPWLPVIRRMGFLTAYVAQDGQAEADIPWHLVDCLFAGGTDAWKFSDKMTALAHEAQSRGKLAHCGRVNSMRRIRMAVARGYDTADGTFLKHGPSTLMRRLETWSEVCR